MMKKKIPWSEKTVRQKAASVGLVTGCFLGAGVLAYAASTYYGHKSFTIDNTKGHVLSIDLTGSVSGIEVVPGTEQTVSPCIENKGTEPMYVFVRFDVGTTNSGGNIYSFTPDNDSGWSQVEAPAGQLLYVYGTNASPVQLGTEDSAELPGTLTCIAEGSDFVSLDSVEVKVTGCAIGSEGEDGESAAEVYADYIELGGE